MYKVGQKIKICPVCSNQFTWSSLQRKYCSDNCKHLGLIKRKRRNAIKIYWRSKYPCPECGKLTSPRAKFCKKCARKGERHPQWKGGRFYGVNDYIRLRKPDHPRADKSGYVLEHIFIWEETHHKSLPKGWIIHHLNGIPDDNRPSNLKALPHKKHSLVLQVKAKRIQELEALLNGQGQLI